MGLRYGVLLATARGLGTNPSAVVDALFSAPGLEPRGARCQDRRIPIRHARELLVESLASNWESWSLDLVNRKRGSWAWAMAEHLVASNTNSFDMIEVSAEGDPPGLVNWVQALCEATQAECALLDTEERIRSLGRIPLRTELHRGLPGVAWVAWFGPQILAAAPQLAESPSWARSTRSSLGVLCTTGDLPPEDGVLHELRLSLDKWLYPNAKAFRFDLSEKNFMTPKWLTSESPPGGVVLKDPRRR